MTLTKIPTWATFALSALAGVLALLNVTSFGLPAVWQDLVTVALAYVTSMGISPLTHVTLQNMLHISHVAALTGATASATLMAFLTQVGGIDQTTLGILIGIITLASGLVFGPAGPTPSPAPAPTPPAVR